MDATSLEAPWYAEIAARRARGVGLEFRAAEFAGAAGSDWPNPDLQSFLDRAAEEGELDRIEYWLCPVRGCGRPLDANMVANDQCPYCRTDYREEGVEPLAAFLYRISGETSRDIHWMIAVHGMNSRAPWQEEFSWRIANKLKYSAPVLIYKYGWITIDVLVLWRHHQLARALGRRLRRAVAFARANGIGDPPDILVHSFGSRLFTLVLDSPEHSDLRFGRVITAGSVVRPDYDWSAHVASGRIEAVLNHVGGRDRPVRFAQYWIPGTGPGGRVGYLDKGALNVASADFGHSDFFTEEALGEILAKGGLWDRFLTHPLATLTAEGRFAASAWRPAFAPLRWVTRLLGILLFSVAAPFSYVRRAADR